MKEIPAKSIVPLIAYPNPPPCQTGVRVGLKNRGWSKFVEDVSLTTDWNVGGLGEAQSGVILSALALGEV